MRSTNILDVLCQQGDLVYGRPPVSISRLLPWEQCVDDWFGTSVGESFEDFKGTHSRDMGRYLLVFPSGSQQLVLFSKSLEFWVGLCRKWKSRQTKISEQDCGVGGKISDSDSRLRLRPFQNFRLRLSKISDSESRLRPFQYFRLLNAKGMKFGWSNGNCGAQQVISVSTKVSKGIVPFQ